MNIYSPRVTFLFKRIYIVFRNNDHSLFIIIISDTKPFSKIQDFIILIPAARGHIIMYLQLLMRIRVINLPSWVYVQSANYVITILTVLMVVSVYQLVPPLVNVV